MALYFPSTSSIFSVYSTISTSVMVLKTMVNELLPETLRSYIVSKLQKFRFGPMASKYTVEIEEYWNIEANLYFSAAETYVPTLVDSSTRILRLGRFPTEDAPRMGLVPDQEVVDRSFENLNFKWKLIHYKQEINENQPKRLFHLVLDRELENRVVDYLDHVVEVAKRIKQERRVPKIYTYNSDRTRWQPTVFRHPASFDKLALEPKQKKFIMDDLNQFIERKEFYWAAGRTWKRSYLLHGPPGTGKTSLVAAMANHLRFDIYDLQLSSISSDSSLRKALNLTSNQSILLIEDIDCSGGVVQDRGSDPDGDRGSSGSDFQSTRLNTKPTLAGLLNSTDGLWSSCGEERIIVFTTNHMDKLDRALVRPGRMDVHIHMSYCTRNGFMSLASTYLRVCEHALFKDVFRYLDCTQVTPAEVAEQLQRGEPDVALAGLIEFLREKNKKANEDEEVTDNSMGKEQAAELCAQGAEPCKSGD